ncbi:PREDICTED: uncharacterized protein LOC105968027 isoform X3 [Erythranthe guttata]|uniref:uncharacterized protein LOC105968027 isoform X3 n=1 Tax=Erythranthe guttata TaxID=4155 RepID=UPI00064DC476|nr:PREDICTED: uncharacterized protein LOC105968027 isoform X3 [Erythranthe guttata]|eukprot:XP_012848073.1 PREDICTED: uncharacterized protein LOC105968027 isoform X3 [Erythranthe guttata]
MPGTIQVTVLEFKGVSSSSKPSAKSLRVSMGKRQYQTWDKGDFSFPITKLREDLVVALLDAGGNEIARADIRTMQVMEKGSWDEVFPIDGGGNVHMKLQFILSDEERNRIRIVRESAVKKKLEMKNINLRLSETVNSSGDSVDTSRKNEQTVSDSEKAIVAIDVMSTKVEASQAGLSLTSALSLSIYQKHGQSILEIAIPNATDTSQDAPSSPDKNEIEIESPQVHKEPVPDEKIEIESPQVHKKPVPDEKIEIQPLANIRLNIEEESASPSMWDKKILVPSKLQDEPVKKSENQGPVKRIPSNVRKMISAFENTQLQEVKSMKRVSSVPSQLNRFTVEGLLEDRESKTVINPPVKSSRNLKNQFDGNLHQEPTALSGKSEPLKELTSTVTIIKSKGNDSKIEDVLSTASKESTMEELDRSPIDLTRQSTSETATTSEFSVAEVSENGIGKETNSKISTMVDIQVASIPEYHKDCYPAPSSDMPMLSAGGNDSNIDDLAKESSRESAIEGLERSSVDLTRQSTSETATTSEGKPEEQFQESEACELSSELLNSSESSGEEEGSGSGRGRETSLKRSTMVNIQVASNPKPKSPEYCKEEEYYSAETSGMWIFPDNTKRLCITTAGNKQDRKIVGGDQDEAKTRHAKKISSESEVLEKNQKKIVDRTKSGCGSSPDDSSNGFLGQVIKVAVIFGFGLLVLLTRQKEPRKKQSKENKNLFTVPDYIDERKLKPWPTSIMKD